MTAIGLISLGIWIGIATLRHGFWRMRERDDRLEAPAPAQWPPVAAIVPARDEAAVITRSVGSLIAQDYPGDFSIVVVDDSSSDGTAGIVRALGSARVAVMTGAPLAPGWTGKLWAVSQGVTAVTALPVHPKYLLMTDADIAHRADTVRSLVARAEREGLVLVSLMARLNCTSLPERMTIPAFVFFFQMLYPFAEVNRPSGPGAAAGGCMLIDARALSASGGVAALRGALIDDCTLGAQMKRHGRIWLGLTDRALSIRPYPRFADVAAMISRSAYAQLGYNPALLVGTIAGLLLIYAVPPGLALFGHGSARIAGLAAWLVMAALFQPILRFYRRSPLWGVALPLIAAFYAGCTLISALDHARGKGGMWKGRAQAALGL